MRTLDELMKEFSLVDSIEDKENWIDNLFVSELKILRDGFEKALVWRANGTMIRSWLYYTEELIPKKIKENRNDKLNELGI